MERKALLIRVGIDKGCGGTLGPIFPDGRFEYIPIPESKQTHFDETYAKLIGRSGETLATYLPKRLAKTVPHFDPEFIGLTYGDPTRIKAAQLKKLLPGDLLVFYAGLESVPPVNGDRPRLFIIGHFEIEAVFDLSDAHCTDLARLHSEIGPNAHLFRKDIDRGLVIVRGRPCSSELYDKAIPLADAHHAMLAGVGNFIEYHGSMLRAVGRWIDGNIRVAALESYLEGGPAALVEKGNQLFSYVLATDGGFAPNPYAGFCTLACCKPPIRKRAQPGDWIVGMCPKKIGSRKVTYAMRVDEVMTFSEYFTNKRFQAKKPAAHPDGDNIYVRLNGGEFDQMPSRHHGVDALAHDTQTDRVLVSGLYWYFGSEPQEPPEELSDHLVHPYVGQKCIDDTAIIRSTVGWLHGNFRPGMHARPRTKNTKSSNSDSNQSPGCKRAC